MAVWADHVLQGKTTFSDFSTFETAFVWSCYPENEPTDTIMKLEFLQYYQGRCSVDAYVDEFEDLIKKADHTNSLAIILKFQCSLNPAIQDKVVELVKDRPRDDKSDKWYFVAC